MKKIEKMHYGYINYEKKKRALLLIFYILIGILIFTVGYIINEGNRANLFTVVAFLSILPIAKKVVELVVILPYKTPPLPIYEKVKSMIEEEAVLICDYVFTSTERSMALDFFVIKEGKALGVAANKKQKPSYIQDYLEKNINNSVPDNEDNFADRFTVRILTDLECFEREYKSMKAVELTTEQREEIVKRLRVLSV